MESLQEGTNMKHFFLMRSCVYYMSHAHHIPFFLMAFNSFFKNLALASFSYYGLGVIEDIS